MNCLTAKTERASSATIKKGRTCGAFTVLEVMIAFAIFSLALTVAVSSFSFFSGKSSDMETEIFIQQDVRNASYKLERRLSMAAEIISPRPVNTSEELTFRDLNGKRIKIKINSTDSNTPIQTFEENNQPEQASNKNQPLYIKNAEYISFTTLSPSAVMIKVRFKPLKKKAGVAESIFYVRLKNANATL